MLGRAQHDRLADSRDYYIWKDRWLEGSKMASRFLNDPKPLLIEKAHWSLRVYGELILADAFGLRHANAIASGFRRSTLQMPWRMH